MSIFGSIVSAIFGNKASAGTVSSAAPAGSSAASPGAAATSAPATGQPMSRAEVEGMIKKLADQSSEKGLNWNESIVDLMKLLNLDSSLKARKELAQELGYTGALDGSAQMNVWLHKQVMLKLAEGGGKVPDSLKTKA